MAAELRSCRLGFTIGRDELPKPTCLKALTGCTADAVRKGMNLALRVVLTMERDCFAFAQGAFC